ncbi:hypothetical protein ACBY01_15615 [Sphingomonas sp. ac-8]|uniref:hypothetical protein n=1 Tax=Sphingomonas sp. ac-8 TaxID=3242977 RepID=UPI003A80B670
MIEWVRLYAVAVVTVALAGCDYRDRLDQEGSERAALALAEAIYPGQFELHGSELEKTRYDVALVKKGDPLTRLRFMVDADPAECRVGTDCERRLRSAHAEAVAVGMKLNAINGGFGKCGLPVLGIDDEPVISALRAIVELDLDPADQQPALDRLTPCVAAFRQALPAGADEAMARLFLRILRPARGGATAPAPLTLDSRLPDQRAKEPSYQITIGARQDRAHAADLRFYRQPVTGSDLDKKLANVATRALAEDPQGGHVPDHALIWRLKLDSQRLDVIRTYVLACSQQPRGKIPCPTDLAVRMRYDLASGEASELAVIRDIRADGSLDLPTLPGR